jgi:cell division protein FtsN
MEKGKSGSSFMNGLFMGILVGIGLSIGITVFITNGKSPFISKDTNGACIEIQGAKAEGESSADNAIQDQPTKFDFYNILPNGDKDISDRETRQALKNPASIPQKELYFYQVGSFNTDKDADNTKAKLALLGFEAVVLTAPSQNNEVVHKVRVGPMTDDAQIMKTKNDLIKNGFKPILVKTTLNNTNTNN